MKLIDNIKKLYNDKTKRKMISSVSFLSLLLIVVMISVLALGKQAYGWFSSNKDVDANNMSVKIGYNDLDVTIYDKDMNSLGALTLETLVSLELELPGSVNYFVLELTNNKETPIPVKEVGFTTPTASEEVPVTFKNEDYYFSTQLQVIGKNLQTTKPTAENLSSNFTAQEVGDFLATAAGEGETQTFTEFIIWQSSNSDTITVNPGSSVYIAVKVTFFNDTENAQNQYRNFGTSNSFTPTSCCKRRIFIMI